MRKRKPMFLLLSALLMMTMVTAACTKKEEAKPSASESSSPQKSAGASEQASEPSALEPVELTYYFPGTPQRDLALVEAEMNKILKEKINATIKLNLLDWGSFEQKMNVMSGAGDSFDLMFTAPWINNYYQNVAKGALLPLDDLLDQYAPKTKAAVPQSVWDSTKINGKIYGSINWQIVAMPYGVSIRKDLADKYKLDLSQMTKYEQLEPFFEQIVQNDKGVTPMSFQNNYDNFTVQAPYFGMDTIGEDASPGWYYLNKPEVKVVNQYATPEFKQFIDLMYQWNQKGYIRKDASSITDTTSDFKAGKYAANVGFPVKPGAEGELKTRYGFEFVTKAFSQPLITTGRAIATMTGISKTSKNPERAMMFIELINSDKDLYNLLCHGIEGKHYVFTNKDKGVIGLPEGVKPEEVGYTPGTDWMFGNQFNGFYASEADVGNWDKTIELNNQAVSSSLLGFNFNPDPVKTELTQTASVTKQYLSALTTGTVDPNKVLPTFLDKLKAAGADKIAAEKQKQIDEWISSKK
ncbi:ABC transporter substrate-binding protein [Cohnella silvisoli]|uniref:ABC transporter substrate-binding protein n=1 Tax=Cohnella silvisoli TaxID=2873699 RepID=A0ABV1L0F0_9BACL|nr:ABC transporter substrate-binding protein [Cohnella silvisoli]MCD9024872.1 ABC transporter substrate-binding protein [Cohnella silvisoli]